MKKSFAFAVFAAALVAPIATASLANAAPIPGLFNTDASLAADGAIDPHWKANGGDAFVYNNPAYLADANARFIAVQADGGYTTTTNTFTLTFDLTGYDPATASLSGKFASDNWGDAFLNGNSLGGQPHMTILENFQSLTDFSATGIDFVNGINTLSFVVTDTGPPSALLVDFTASQVSASAVPEPLTLSLFVGGLVGAGWLRRRKTAKAA